MTAKATNLLVRVWLAGLFLGVKVSVAHPPNVAIFFSDDQTQQAISGYLNLPDALLQDLVFKN